MQHRRLDHHRHVRAVRPAPRILRQRRKANQVVRHQVNRPANGVPLKLRHVQRLSHNALANHRGIAVHEYRDHRPPVVRVATQPLLGPHPALCHRIGRLKVAGVACK